MSTDTTDGSNLQQYEEKISFSERIDFQSAQEYLEQIKTKKIFIPPGHVFFDADFQTLKLLIKNYKEANVSKIFPDSLKFYTAEVFCSACKLNAFIEDLSKTKLFVLCKNENITCPECEKEALQRRKNLEKEYIENREQNSKIKTTYYIENYLNPNRIWNEGIKLYEKFQIISNPYVNMDKISDYIKSMDYSDFLKTPYWKAVTLKKMYHANFRCELCNSQGKLATHHRTYNTHGKEHLHLNDLIVLCFNCHEKFHSEGSK